MLNNNKSSSNISKCPRHLQRLSSSIETSEACGREHRASLVILYIYLLNGSKELFEC